MIPTVKPFELAYLAHTFYVEDDFCYPTSKTCDFLRQKEETSCTECPYGGTDKDGDILCLFESACNSTYRQSIDLFKQQYPEYFI